MNKNNQSVEYLQNVLTKWEVFCKMHKPFKKAIQDILTRNYMLQIENDELRKQVEELVGVNNDTR